MPVPQRVNFIVEQAGDPVKREDFLRDRLKMQTAVETASIQTKVCSEDFSPLIDED
ncbi:MAG: hypothetical protein ACMG55_11100 [Microcoleus sp.]